MIDCIDAIHKKNETKQSQLIGPVWSVTTTRLDNDVTDHPSVVYAKNDIKLSWSIRPDANYDDNIKR